MTRALRRAVVINNIPTPYINALFSATSRAADFELRFIFLAEGDHNRSWSSLEGGTDFSYEVLPAIAGFVRNVDLTMYAHWGLWSRLRAADADVVCICGYHYFASLEVLAFKTLYKRGAVLWSGSHKGSGAFGNRVTDIYKRAVIPRFDAFLAYGSAAAEGIVNYGGDPQRIVVGCNAVDTSRFAPGEPGGVHATGLRVLCIAELVKRKGIDDLIRAVSIVRARGVDAELSIVGSGPELAKLKAIAVHEGCASHVSFLGHKATAEMPGLYRTCDVVVLPSHREVWGLVVNEAMAAGVPVVVSRAAGCARDLVVEGKTGLTFAPGDHVGLAACIERLAVDPNLRIEMRRAALQKIEECGIPQYAQRLIAALKLAAEA